MNWIALATSLVTMVTAIVGFIRLRAGQKAIDVKVDGNLTSIMDKLGVERDTSEGLRTELKAERDKS